MKEIIKTSLIETVAFILIRTALNFWDGMIAKWFVYPIEFAILFVGILLANIGFKRYMYHVIFRDENKKP